jgi:hypothetical protein
MIYESSLLIDLDSGVPWLQREHMILQLTTDNDQVGDTGSSPVTAYAGSPCSSIGRAPASDHQTKSRCE